MRVRVFTTACGEDDPSGVGRRIYGAMVIVPLRDGTWEAERAIPANETEAYAG